MNMKRVTIGSIVGLVALYILGMVIWEMVFTDFFAANRIVSTYPVRAGHNCLLLAIDVADDWCAIGFLEFTIVRVDGRTISFPGLLASFEINGSQELLIIPIAN